MQLPNLVASTGAAVHSMTSLASGCSCGNAIYEAFEVIKGFSTNSDRSLVGRVAVGVLAVTGIGVALYALYALVKKIVEFVKEKLSGGEPVPTKT